MARYPGRPLVYNRSCTTRMRVVMRERTLSNLIYIYASGSAGEHTVGRTGSAYAVYPRAPYRTYAPLLMILPSPGLPRYLATAPVPVQLPTSLGLPLHARRTRAEAVTRWVRSLHIIIIIILFFIFFRKPAISKQE